MTRNTDIPIGRITASGYGVQRAAGVIHWYVLYEGAQVVFVNDDGHVVCVPLGTHKQLEMIKCNPDWLIGHYADGRQCKLGSVFSRQALIADLRVRVRELPGLAA